MAPASHLRLVSIGSALLVGLLAGTLGAAEPAAPREKPLVAHWTFDEAGGAVCRDASGNGWEATLRTSPTELPRRRGLFGSAAVLTGVHRIEVAPTIPLAQPNGLTFSVWVKPTDLSRYREIFRKEDGNQRVLFSFQDDGRILSLGLNIGRYDECDAKIDPARLRDGRWHHCAATFDGRWMRVYLDGDEVGRLERPGTIHAGGPAPACIGSSGGGENFQGDMDDLRIYAAPLSGGEIAGLYRVGLERIEQMAGQLAKQVAATYQRKATLAETLLASRLAIVERGWMRDVTLAQSIAARLKADFPAAYDEFAEYAAITPRDYLSNPDPNFHVTALRQQVEMLLEYQPLTEEQRRRQTPDDAKKWAQREPYRAKLAQLETQGTAGRTSPAWVELLVEIGRQIDFRPSRYEAVAPYITPATPPVQNLTADEAQAALRSEWLFQAGLKPTRQQILDEIGWARQLADRLEQPDLRFDVERKALAELERQAAADGATEALYLQVRQVKRTIAFRNPLLNIGKLLLVDMPLPQGREWQHETRHRLGYMAVPGARLMTLDGLRPDGKLTQLMPQAPLHGSFWRPDVSFDGRKALFCFKPHNEKSFHLYEIGIDGSGLRQLTDGQFDDLDPIYLPDGEHILFSTTRGHTYVRCMPPTNAFVLARCDRDGRNVYLVSPNNEPDYLPSLMHDGRVIYTRWEYTDKPLWRAQKLWTVNPDGTQVNTYWGNQSVWPDVMKDVRAIPGSRRVMFTGCGHHNWFAGSIGIIDPDRGFNFPDGITKVTAELPWPEVGNGPVDPLHAADYHVSGAYTAYFSPYPLGADDFLVSAERRGKFVLLWMDVHGNRELIYEGVHNVFHAMPAQARTRPPVVPDRVAWPSREAKDKPASGVIFSGNVYQNAPPELRGQARFLRVMTIDPKTYTYWYKRPYISTGPVVSIVQSEGVKRVLGTVPIEADGSVAFRVPAGKALHFQLLDEQQRALQTMRSFVGVMPGEYRGCLGCHESHSRAPTVEAAAALGRPPHEIKPPDWSDDTVSFPRYVRPMLDTYCTKCHQEQAEAKQAIDLTPRPGFLGFDEAYAHLTGMPTWGKSYEIPSQPKPGWGIADMLMVEGYDKVDPRAYQTPPPMTKLSYRSRLVELASSGKHYGVRVDPTSLLRLQVWIDAMCPYNGDEEVRSEPDPVFPGVDWLAIRPRIQTAPRIVRPGPVD